MSTKTNKTATEAEKGFEEMTGSNTQPPTNKTGRKMKEVTRPAMVEFDVIGKIAAGTIVAITEGETQFGAARFLQLVSDEGEKLSVCLSSSMALYDWDAMTGKYVEIEYTGEEKSKKNKGKTFKTFAIRAEE